MQTIAEQTVYLTKWNRVENNNLPKPNQTKETQRYIKTQNDCAFRAGVISVHAEQNEDIYVHN